MFLAAETVKTSKVVVCVLLFIAAENSPKVVKTVSLSELSEVIGVLAADHNNTEEGEHCV